MFLFLEDNQVFQASYAWVGTSLPGKRGVVSLALRGPDGWLWQKRSNQVACPNLWDFAASGTLEHPDPEAQVRQEALEEIGQEELPGLCLLCRQEVLGGVVFLFQADWSGEEIIASNEVEELTWSSILPEPALLGAKILSANIS